MIKTALTYLSAFEFKLDDKDLHNCIAQTYDNKYQYLCAKLYLDYETHKLMANIDKNNKVIVDIGCGTGILLPYVLNYCNSYLGLDQSEEMIKSAVKKNGTSSFLLGDGEQLPFKDRSISTIICRGSLHHISDPNIALNEFYRVLEKKGKLILVEPNNSNILIQFLRFVMTKIDNGYSSRQKQFNALDIINLLEENEFNNISIEYIGYISNLFERPDKFIIAKYINKSLMEKIIKLDDIISKCNSINRYSWGL